MLEVFLVALRLGLTSLGGPIAHIGIFRDELVVRRGWVDERGFGELVAVTSLLPGPSSSQLGIAIGTLRAGKRGGFAAWLGFTLPSAIAMTLLGFLAVSRDLSAAGWVRGLELAAVAIVLGAVVAMRRALAPDAPRVLIAVGGAVMALVVAGFPGQVLVIGVAGLIGALAFQGDRLGELHLRFPMGRRLAVGSAIALGALLVGLPLVREAGPGNALALTDAMVRAGALVFGGGHVVLPLLHESVVESGWVGEEAFLAGYGAAQALPGPLFSFSAFLGAASEPTPNGVAGAALAVGAIFLPSFLLLGLALPLWSTIRRHPRVQAAVTGIGAGVVGLLAAALWDPVLTTAVDGAVDVVLVGVLVGALRVLPPWAVVALAAGLGALVL